MFSHHRYIPQRWTDTERVRQGALRTQATLVGLDELAAYISGIGLHMFILWLLTVSKLHIHCLKWVDGLQQPAIIAAFLPDDDRALGGTPHRAAGHRASQDSFNHAV